MTVDTDATATAMYPYYVRVGLTNVSDIPVYNPSVALSRQANSHFIYQPQQQSAYSTDVVMPGETFWTPYYILIPEISGVLDLSQSFVKDTGGTADLSSTITDHPDIDPAETAPTLTAIPVYHGVGLIWQSIPGASSYDIYSTSSPDTPFGMTPLGSVSGDSTQFVANGLDPGVPQYFAVSPIVRWRPHNETPAGPGVSVRNVD